MRLLPSLGMLLAASSTSFAADVETYLGLTDFRHVQPSVTDVACGHDAWERGNFFTNSKNDRLFSPGTDSLTLKLKAAFFPYTPETNIFGRVKTSQVGIFADVTMKDGSVAAPGSQAIAGRLIFFSEDYVQGQLRIPDINTNIYGPVPYHGGGLSLKFTLLEFDQSEKDQLADSLLKGIADLGVKASAGVPSYLQAPLGALFQSAFATAKSKDDVFGRITFVLDDRNGAGNPMTTPLRTGDIVFVRATDRKTRINWDELCFNPFTGDVTLGKIATNKSTSNSVTTRGEMPVTGAAKEVAQTAHATSTTLPEVRERAIGRGVENKARDQSDEGQTEEAAKDAVVATAASPGIAFITVSLLKNAGSEAGRVQDALAYEQFVQDLNGRANSAGLVASTRSVMDALGAHALAKELHRLASTLEMEKGTLTAVERFDAASRMASVIQASSLAASAVDVSTLKVNPSCAYLVDEIIKVQDIDRLIVRLEGSIGGLKNKINSALHVAPTTCADALTHKRLVTDALIDGR